MTTDLKTAAQAAENEALNAVGYVGQANYADREREARGWVREAFRVLYAALAATPPVAVDAKPAEFFCYTNEMGFERFKTTDEAMACAEGNLKECRKDAEFDKEWPEDVETICCGVITHKCIAIEETEEHIDYGIRTAASPAAATPVAAEVVPITEAAWCLLRDCANMLEAKQKETDLPKQERYVGWSRIYVQSLVDRVRTFLATAPAAEPAGVAELPEPHGYVGASLVYCLHRPGDPLMKTMKFTADQLRTYGQQCHAAGREQERALWELTRSGEQIEAMPERWREEQAKAARGEPACTKCTPYRDFATGKFERHPCECAPAQPSAMPDAGVRQGPDVLLRYRDALTEQSAASGAWQPLTEGERNQAVDAICQYGTGFVAPLYAIVEGIERKLMERNAFAFASLQSGQENAAATPQEAKGPSHG